MPLCARCELALKKYLVADLVKVSYDETIKDIADRLDISYSEAEYLYENYPNEADQMQVMYAAEALGVGIQDVEDDDVENLQDIWDMGGSRGTLYSEIESSIGKVYPWYDPVLKSLMVLIIFNEGNPANYPISKSDLADISNAGSFGKYYSDNMRNNDSYSDKPGAWGCIGPNPDSPKRLGNADDFAKLPKELQAYLTRYIS